MAGWLFDALDQQKAPGAEFETSWSKGPPATIGEVITSSFKDAYKTRSMWGMQAELLDRMNSQWEGATGEKMDLNQFSLRDAKDIARYYVDGTPLPNDERMAGFRTNIPGLADRVAEYEKRTGSKLKDTWDEVTAMAKDVADEAADVSNRAGWGTEIFGSIIGGGAGSLTLRDPLNLTTLGIGGVGKTVFMRLATEAGANSAVEAVDIATGVAENRRLLGLPMSAGEIAQDIAITALGAATMRGVFFEAPKAVFGGKPKPHVETALPKTVNTPEIPRTFVQKDGISGAWDQVVTARVGRSEPKVPFTIQSVERGYEVRYLSDMKTPVAVRPFAIADMKEKNAALDRAVVEGVFDDPDITLREALNSVRGSNGEARFPFRFLDPATPERDIDAVIREGFPNLTNAKRDLETRLGNIERQIELAATHTAVPARGDQPPNAAAQLAYQRARLTELQSQLAKGEHPKKRTRELVERDITETKGRIGELRAAVLKNMPFSEKLVKRLERMSDQLGEVNAELGHIRTRMEAERGAKVPPSPPKVTDPLTGESFMPASATKVEFVTKLDEALTDFEGRLDDFVPIYDEYAKFAEDTELEKVDIGGEDVLLDMKYIDEDGNEKTFRQGLKELKENDDIEKATKECLI